MIILKKMNIKKKRKEEKQILKKVKKILQI
jgi:hypothetical protein